MHPDEQTTVDPKAELKAQERETIETRSVLFDTLEFLNDHEVVGTNAERFVRCLHLIKHLYEQVDTALTDIRDKLNRSPK